MRIHDWSRVDDGIFHNFLHLWIAEIKRVLNGGPLPPTLYALSEQHASEFDPDVLALQIPNAAQEPAELYTRRQKPVVVHHASDDRIVAIIEVVSPGNKSSQRRLDSFVRKACSLLLWKSIC